MATKENLDTVLIKMAIENEQVLFILLSSDGTINRMGYGNDNFPERDLFIGTTPENLFAQLMEYVQESDFKYAGFYTSPEIKGKKCELIIVFSGEGEEVSFTYHYGQQSAGPHLEITEIVKKAIEITEPWYLQQRDS